MYSGLMKPVFLATKNGEHSKYDRNNPSVNFKTFDRYDEVLKNFFCLVSHILSSP